MSPANELICTSCMSSDWSGRSQNWEAAKATTAAIEAAAIALAPLMVPQVPSVPAKHLPHSTVTVVRASPLQSALAKP